MKFINKGGNHYQTKDSPPCKKGETIETDMDLAKAFPAKFTRVAYDTPSNKAGSSEDTVVTDRFDEAAENGLVVKLNDKVYSVFEEEDEELTCLTDGKDAKPIKSMAAAKKFIKTYIA